MPAVPQYRLNKTAKEIYDAFTQGRPVILNNNENKTNSLVLSVTREPDPESGNDIVSHEIYDGDFTYYAYKDDLYPKSIKNDAEADAGLT